ncbi:MAG TPA: complex I NDUFA9 subunit family protein [Verrucomicrobiae bacterium]|nr:complex I NDUFA9 subunit family protein [Verrucomicrobiae bacterium]
MARPVATIFGGSGFIGRYIVQRLARRGWILRIAVRRPDSALFLKPLGDVGQITPMAANIRHDASVAAAIEGVDHVINLVGVLYEHGPQRFAAVHAEGARRVASAARAAGVKRLLQMSALGADAGSPSLYARTKAEGEAMVREAFPEAVILRPSVVFGPEDDFFNRFAEIARFSPILPLIGGGKTRFQPVYVGDVADAAVAILDRPEDAPFAPAGKTYELAGPRIYSFKQLMELLLAEIGRKRILMPVPWGIARLQAAVLGLLPQPPLTLDQLKLLQRDNIAGGQLPGFADLGIVPDGPEAILPAYLDRFRAGGRFARA